MSDTMDSVTCLVNISVIQEEVQSRVIVENTVPFILFLKNDEIMEHVLAKEKDDEQVGGE